MSSPTYDAESDFAAWGVGAGTLLVEAFALIPGLLPCLLLLLPLVLPFVLLGVLAGLLFALPVGTWRLIRLVTSSASGFVKGVTTDPREVLSHGSPQH
jgi:hypothetical protein